MKNLTAFYFSGTGNTRYVVSELCKSLSKGYETAIFDISFGGNFGVELNRADCVMLAFPIYGSSPPLPMRRFVYENAKYLNGKDVIVVETQYMFSGDGAASLGRTVEKLGGKVIAAEHFNMPNNLSDCKIFKIRNGTEINATLLKARRKADVFAHKILSGKKRRCGHNIFSHSVGYICQRALWRRHEQEKRTLLKIDPSGCVGCGACVKTCPANNLRIVNGRAVATGNCALCYRCVNLCPKRAITLIGSQPPQKQYKGPPF